MAQICRAKGVQVQLCPILWTPRTGAQQAPLGNFPGKEHWSALPFPTLGDLPNTGIEPTSSASPILEADSLPLCRLGRANKDHKTVLQGSWDVNFPQGLLSLLLQCVRGFVRNMVLLFQKNGTSYFKRFDSIWTVYIIYLYWKGLFGHLDDSLEMFLISTV